MESSGEQLVRWLDHFLATPGPLLAVAIGLLLCWSGTQAIKFLPVVQKLPADARRGLVRAIAFGLGWLPVVVLWPGAWPVRLLAGAVTGLCAPTAYTYAVRIAYHFWPWLEPRLSASPPPKRSP